MINFFRRIRKKMADENKPLKPAWPAGRYMRYAIGEILLVVVGILIALQVNNWNENKKIRQTEFKLLAELKTDLIETKTDLLSDIEKANAILKSTDSLYQKISARIKEENLFPVRISMLYVLDRSDLYPKKSAYESLQAYGINLISNDSLRKNITDFYELHLLRVDHLEKIILELGEKELGPYLRQNSKTTNDCEECTSLKNLLPSLSHMNSDFYLLDKPTDELLLLLKRKYIFYLAIKGRYNTTQLKIENLMETIDSETAGAGA